MIRLLGAQAVAFAEARGRTLSLVTPAGDVAWLTPDEAAACDPHCVYVDVATICPDALPLRAVRALRTVAAATGDYPLASACERALDGASAPRPDLERVARALTARELAF